MKILALLLSCISLLLAPQTFAVEVSMVSMYSNTKVLIPNSFYTAQYVTVPFVVVDHDEGGYWDALSNQYIVPSDIPAGTYGVIQCHVRWFDTGGLRVQSIIAKYDASAGVQLDSNFPESAPSNQPFTGGTTTDYSAWTHPVLLEPGDAYSCKVWQNMPLETDVGLYLMQAGMSITVYK